MTRWPSPLPLDNQHAKSIVICAIVFPTIATLAVVGRFCARRMKKAAFEADDWIILPALAAVYAQMTIIILSVIYGGVGHHIEDLGQDNLVAFFKLIAAVQFSFGSSLGLAKISLCFLLMRIFFVRSFRIAAFCIMTYCACWMLMVIFIGAGLCRPFQYNWDKSIPNGHCGALDPAYISIAVLDIVGDAMIVALPMPSIWRLHTTTTTKIGLSAVFALGFVDIIVSILRIVYLVETDYSPPSDFTWASTGTYLWSVIEPSLGVTVACAVTLRPIFSTWLPKFTSSLVSRFGYTRKFSRDQEAYSNIDKGGYPLHPVQVGHSSTTAGSGENCSSFQSGGAVESGKAQNPFKRDGAVPDLQVIRVDNEFMIHSVPKKDSCEVN